MGVREVFTKPEAMNHFPDDRYRWLEMYDQDEVYGHAAIAERDDDLELHVTLYRWGPQIRRNVQADVVWVKNEARRLGKKRIMGIRANSSGIFDQNLFRFAGLYGFTEKCVFQTVVINIES